ncbi:MAG TPA: PrsW family glutamic-type intramembrane protease [Candidatus Paceibacterota bacterium]|nr:PrsW family glutamic-type intramembrane protease [Candidatus Paceibacterota bacterium]
MTFTTLGYAFIGGLLPAFIWLYFLLQEDARHPEPKRMIALAFIAGMAAVPLVIPLEQWARIALGNNIPELNISILTAWALIEEILKYGMAAAFIFWRPAVDEAPDYVIYMVTVALGFASAENMLFLITPLSLGHVAASILTDDVRFIGSTLLHVFASASIGFALAFSAKSSMPIRVVAAGGGLILAVALHTTFNALIMTEGASTIFTAVLLVWIAAVIFFAAFEVLKFFEYHTFSRNIYPPL